MTITSFPIPTVTIDLDQVAADVASTAADAAATAADAVATAADRVLAQTAASEATGASVLYMLDHTGQSEGVPRGNSRVSNNAPAKARMFSAGVHPHVVNTPRGITTTLAADTSANVAHNIYMDRLSGLVPLQEYAGYETPWTGCAAWVPEYQTVSFYSGAGSRSLAELSGAGIFLTSETQCINRFGALARAEAKTPAWPFSVVTQGHADAILGTTAPDWKDAAKDLQRWRTDLASACWGFTVPLVPHITEVMNNSGYAGTTATEYAETRAIMQAQSEISEENSGWFCAGPTYQWFTEDAVHTDSRERRLRGEMFGKVGRKIMRGEEWVHCFIEGASAAGATITVTTVSPVGDLVADTVLVNDPGDYGFEVFDSGGSALTVSSVTVGATGDDKRCTITIEVASGTPATLRYAMQELGYKAGPGTDNPVFGGARGCIRDSDPSTAYYDGTPLYNWLCPKEVSL